MDTTQNDTRTLRERAMAEYEETNAAIEQSRQEHAREEQSRNRARFARVLYSPNFGNITVVPDDTTVTIDGVTLRYRYRHDGYVADDVISMAAPCKMCGTGQAWIEVHGLYDIARVLRGERWGGIGSEQCMECQVAAEEAREAATADKPAYAQEQPSAAERFAQALAELLAEHGYTIYAEPPHGPEDY
jgi:hypothetical protein